MKLIRVIKASQDFKKDLKKYFKKSPKEAFYYFEKLCKNNENIPSAIIKIIFDEGWFLTSFLELFVKYNINISNDSIKIIFKEGYIDEFAEQLLKYKKNIPDIILNSIAKDSDDSLEFAEQLLKYKKIYQILF